MNGQASPNQNESLTYSLGYALALTLTVCAFALVYWHPLSPHWTLGLVFGLALIQIIVHFRCFLHITLGRSARADLQVLLFSALIVLLMVGGTIVVMLNLRSRMM